MHRKRKKERYVEEDDGRSFANMNVEGMPWYRPPQEGDTKKGDTPQLAPNENKYDKGGVLKAALLVGLVCIAVFIPFIVILDLIVFEN